MATTNRPSARRTTIKHVAADAQVSVQTVSNFINGRFGQMSGATRARVEEAMDRLGYYPDATARGLRSARTRTLGFLVLDEHTAFLADPLTALMLSGVGDVARARKFGILVQAGAPGDADYDPLLPFRERRIDGAFAVLSGPPELRAEYIDRVAALGEELVVFDEILDSGHSALSVRASEREGAQRLTEHLIARGHSRIAFIGPRAPWAVIEQRLAGYHDALDAAGLEWSGDLERLEATGYEPAGGAAMVGPLLALDEPPTAMLCGSDLLALAAMRVIRDAGLAIPDDIAVAGFDDFNFSSLVEPALTTVKVPGYEMGRAAATMLIDRLEGRDVPNQHEVFTVELKVRAST